MKLSKQESGDLLAALQYARNAELNARLYTFNDDVKAFHNNHVDRLNSLIEKFTQK